MGIDAGFEVPQFSIHRGRLQGVIYQAARARLGESRFHFGSRLGAFTQDDAGVTAYFFDRNGSHHTTARGDVLIGADGIHSFVRDKLYPNEGPPAWNGLMLWRGATDWPQFLTGRSMMIAGGLEAKFVLYPIGAGSAPDRRLTNWAVVARVADGSTPPPRREDWSRPGRWEDLGPHLKRFRIPYCDVTHLIEATGEFWEYPMCDRDPLAALVARPRHAARRCRASRCIRSARTAPRRRSWMRAASPTGSSAPSIRCTRSPPTRRSDCPPTAQIVRMNRKGGPEGVIDAVEALAPDGFTNIDDVMSYEQRMAIVRGYASTAGFAREQVNRVKG